MTRVSIVSLPAQHPEEAKRLIDRQKRGATSARHMSAERSLMSQLQLQEVKRTSTRRCRWKSYRCCCS
ncbi:predicted protein [Histoplasma capsulatum var. duboisii H88]|uniref:Predicted protein n=1 Tax=Ajellomyces capsulatus (strain H88) TaxID=544711 RepID=F0UNH6_AJEC8|nr:predicted protein [Histoplasma capsulatum var. duboisii H88]